MQIKKPVTESISYILKDFDELKLKLIESVHAFNVDVAMLEATEELVKTAISAIEKITDEFTSTVSPLVIEVRSEKDRKKELEQVRIYSLIHVN